MSAAVDNSPPLTIYCWLRLSKLFQLHFSAFILVCCLCDCCKPSLYLKHITLFQTFIPVGWCSHRWLRLIQCKNMYFLPFLPLKAPKWRFPQLIQCKNMYLLPFLPLKAPKWRKVESVKLGKTPFWGFQGQKW